MAPEDESLTKEQVSILWQKLQLIKLIYQLKLAISTKY